MKIYAGLLMFCSLLGTGQTNAAARGDGYVATVIGYYSDGTPKEFGGHDCSSSRWAEEDAMRSCMKVAQSCQLVETKPIFCRSVKCVC